MRRRQRCESVRLRVEFLVEPFSEGDPGPHVRAAVVAIEQAGLAVELGPFGSSTEGDSAEVLSAIYRAVEAALEAGAVRIGLTIARPDET